MPAFTIRIVYTAFKTNCNFGAGNQQLALDVLEDLNALGLPRPKTKSIKLICPGEVELSWEGMVADNPLALKYKTSLSQTDENWRLKLQARGVDCIYEVPYSTVVADHPSSVSCNSNTDRATTALAHDPILKANPSVDAHPRQLDAMSGPTFEQLRNAQTDGRVATAHSSVAFGEFSQGHKERRATEAQNEAAHRQDQGSGIKDALDLSQNNERRIKGLLLEAESHALQERRRRDTIESTLLQLKYDHAGVMEQNKSLEQRCYDLNAKLTETTDEASYQQRLRAQAEDNLVVTTDALVQAQAELREARLALSRMKEDLVRETAQRRRAEAEAEDLKREHANAFIVPALMDAFLQVSQVSTFRD